MGKTIVSSADLVSRFEAVLTDEQEKSHYEAQGKLDDDPRQRLSRDWPPRPLRRRHHRIRDGPVVPTRHGRRAAWYWEHGPNVSVNANSANSHYEPTADQHAPSAPATFC